MNYNWSHIMIRILIILSSVFYLLAIPSSGFGKTYHVYYLGGQSNMDGYGTVNELPSRFTMVAPLPMERLWMDGESGPQ